MSFEYEINAKQRVNYKQSSIIQYIYEKEKDMDLTIVMPSIVGLTR